MSARVAAVVPTLGASPHLHDCLRALAREGLRTLLVAQGEVPACDADQRIEREHPLGFAAAVNLGLAAVDEGYVAVVNDDAVVAEGWLAPLLETLDKDPAAAAAQGAQLRFGEASLVEGRGIAWNAWWQAVQLGDGEPADLLPERRQQVFGVSATAALYRRAPLEQLREKDGSILDERLDTYYEDVDLAGRLRGMGYRAWSVPAARARHGASVTGRLRPSWREVRIRGNRYPVLARLLGASFWPRLPKIVARDAWDGLRGGPAGARVIASGWARGLRLLPAFARGGPALVPLAQLRGFRSA